MTKSILVPHKYLLYLATLAVLSAPILLENKFNPDYLSYKELYLSPTGGLGRDLLFVYIFSTGSSFLQYGTFRIVVAALYLILVILFYKRILQVNRTYPSLFLLFIVFLPVLILKLNIQIREGFSFLVFLSFFLLPLDIQITSSSPLRKFVRRTIFNLFGSILIAFSHLPSIWLLAFPGLSLFSSFFSRQLTCFLAVLYFSFLGLFLSTPAFVGLTLGDAFRDQYLFISPSLSQLFNYSLLMLVPLVTVPLFLGSKSATLMQNSPILLPSFTITAPIGYLAFTLAYFFGAFLFGLNQYSYNSFFRVYVALSFFSSFSIWFSGCKDFRYQFSIFAITAIILRQIFLPIL